MKQSISILFFINLFSFVGNSQTIDPGINKDSLLKASLRHLPAETQKYIIEMYNLGPDDLKEMILVQSSMERSSKAELIKNLDSIYANIEQLKEEYQKLIPENLTVSIEFNPANKVFRTAEYIDMSIIKKNGNDLTNYRKWNLKYNSKELKELLDLANLNIESLEKIKNLLKAAKCVSIENGEITTIGFSRNGTGKFYFKIFKKDLSLEEIKKCNNRCDCIFYKNNIVLGYGGGATNNDCFPDY